MELKTESDSEVQRSDRTRLRLAIRGAVQGVGFRPFVFRLAEDLHLPGWVNNTSQGVFIEVEGTRSALEDFLLRVEREKPPLSSIQSLEASWLDPVGYSAFEIRQSEAAGSKTALVLPDIATCPDCLREIFDPANRRFQYPFTNCTNCGPRFTIIERLPYDRANTSMKSFAMCAKCQAEYDDPRDRRFHAQPNACPVCGPRVALWNPAGTRVFRGDAEATAQVLQRAVRAIQAGQIVAVKGLGGFHLIVLARDEAAVRRLRERKHREEKPLAVMFPSLSMVRSACEVSPLEERLLRSPEAPIVLLRRGSSDGAKAPVLAPSIAPGNPNLGVMLPYTPLHHLLLSALQVPVVATSGNLSDEPICIDEHEALRRLGGIADLFLVHNRPIVRHVDDSIVRVMAGRELVLRRARGFAPLPVQIRQNSGRKPILGVGAHLKNAVALSVGPQIFVSQHIGDLETEQAYDAFRRVIRDFEKLYEASPAELAADAHPDYLSTSYARALCDSNAGSRSAAPARLLRVQHHLAHVLSCMAENELDPPVLGVSWDGTGYGLDGTVWGGEFFHVTGKDSRRVAHLRPFPLPGGDKAIKEPRRTALGLLFESMGQPAFAMKHLAALGSFSASELASLEMMLRRRLNSPLTSSVGRLFDGVASFCGLRQEVRFEGQAAMELEFALETCGTDRALHEEGYPIRLANGPVENANLAPRLIVDWGPLLGGVLSDLQGGIGVGQISARFHNGLVQAILDVAGRIGEKRVVLSGGCFQNRYLTETAVRSLGQAGFRAYWHQRVPPNDGGIALGQVAAALGQTSLG